MEKRHGESGPRVGRASRGHSSLPNALARWWKGEGNRKRSGRGDGIPPMETEGTREGGRKGHGEADEWMAFERTSAGPAPSGDYADKLSGIGPIHTQCGVLEGRDGIRKWSCRRHASCPRLHDSRLGSCPKGPAHRRNLAARPTVSHAPICTLPECSNFPMDRYHRRRPPGPRAFLLH